MNGKYLLLLAGMFIILPCSLSAENAAQSWDKLEKKIRDGNIQKSDAKTFIKALQPLLDSYYTSIAGETGAPEFVFPVEGYGPNSIGGTHGNGYVEGNYDFYEGNKHGGHPAQDIFIRDNDFDYKDDSTGLPVRILSASNGVVAAVNTGWQENSEIRGGNYIWVYDPSLKGLYYYAHMDKVSVIPGDIVKAGQEVGTMGRSGKNAYPRRSPTHLHFMYLSYGKDGALQAENTYRSLSGGTVSPAAVQSTAGANKILQGAKKWIQHRVVYRNAYHVLTYPGGDVPADEGVCTDVVVRALREAGYDLQKLIHEDAKANFEKYPLKSIWRQTKPDKNIDHRRCPNQIAFFERFAKALPTSTAPAYLNQWQPGDIVFWDLGYANMLHTGIVSDRKNNDGVPYVIHNYPDPGYASEADVLKSWKIIKHFRYK